MGSISNNGVARHGRYTKVLSDLGLELPSGAIVSAGAIDPSVTALLAPAGSVYLSSLTNNIYVKEDAGTTTNWHVINHDSRTKEPTGFLNNETVVANYSVANQTVSLYNTATPTLIEFMIRGRYFAYAASVGTPWPVPTILGGGTAITHVNSSGLYFLKIKSDTLAIDFDTTPWAFTDLMIAVAFKNATAQFGLREAHGLMPHLVHEEFHNTNGTYIRTAPALTKTGTYPSTDTETALFSVANVTVYDEDLPTLILATARPVWAANAYTSGVCTVAYHAGPAGLVNFYPTSRVQFITDNPPVPAAPTTNPIKYTALSAGTGIGTLTDVAENEYVNIFTVAIPVTADVESQVFRRIYFVGQRTFTTLAAARLESPAQVDFGELRTVLPESVVTSMITYQKNAVGLGSVLAAMGTARVEEAPVVFTGTRTALIGVSGVSPTDHQTLSNRNATAAHPGTAIDLTGTSWTTGVLSVETTVTAALDKLSSTFAGAAAVGLVSTGTQTFAGAKTFAALSTFSLGLAVSGGVAAAGSLTRSGTTWTIGNGPTITEAGAATFATSVSTPSLIIQAGGAAGLGKIAYAATTGFNINNGALVVSDSGSVTLEKSGTAFTMATNYPYIGSKNSNLTFSTVGSSFLCSGAYYDGAWRNAFNNLGGAFLELDAAALGSGQILGLYTQQNYASVAGSSILPAQVLSCTGAGAWTFPVSVAIGADNLATNHNLVLRSSATSCASLVMYNNNVVKGYIGSNGDAGNSMQVGAAAGDLVIRSEPGNIWFSGAGTVYGKCIAGAWALGAATAFNAPFGTQQISSGTKCTAVYGGSSVPLVSSTVYSFIVSAGNFGSALVVLAWFDSNSNGSVLLLCGSTSVAIVSSVGGSRVVVGAPGAGQYGVTFNASTATLTLTTGASLQTSSNISVLGVAAYLAG